MYEYEAFLKEFGGFKLKSKQRVYVRSFAGDKNSNLVYVCYGGGWHVTPKADITPIRKYTKRKR